jgi:hypothetical protein
LRKGDGLILTSDLTTDGPRSVLLSFGDEAVTALEPLAQRRRLSFRKAGDTERVNSLAINKGLVNADRCTVECRGVLGVEPRDIGLGFRFRFLRGELKRPITRFVGGGLIDRLRGGCGRHR